MYDQQLAIWESIFPRSSFCIIDQNYLINSPAKALSLVSNFIGLEKFDWSVNMDIRNTSTLGAVGSLKLLL
jgi:hypothetical protein